MGKDRKDTLQWLEDELLAEETPRPRPEEEEDEEFRLVLGDDTAPPPGNVAYRNFANGYQAYTNQKADVDMDDYSRQVEKAGNRKLGRIAIILGLILCGLGLAGIVAILGYMGG